MLRGDSLHFAKPHLFYTSEVFEKFFQMSFGVELGDWVQKLECYKLGSVSGTPALPLLIHATDYVVQG